MPVLVSAVQQCSSALSIHVALLSSASLPPRPTRPGITEHWPELPYYTAASHELSTLHMVVAIYVKATLLIHPPSLSPATSTSPFSTSVFLFLPHKQVHQYHFSRSIYVYGLPSLAAQMVKKPPAMEESCVQSLRWEGPLEEGLATHPSILAWRIPMDRGT